MKEISCTHESSRCVSACVYRVQMKEISCIYESFRCVSAYGLCRDLSRESSCIVLQGVSLH